MAGNDWLNGYLEAILDAGSKSNTKKGNDGRQKIAKFEQQVKEEKLFSPTKYFVEEVVNSFDESDLHRTWVKVSLFFSYLLRSISAIFSWFVSSYQIEIRPKIKPALHVEAFQ